MNSAITIKELYEWAVEHNCEDAEIFIPSYNEYQEENFCPAIDWDMEEDENGKFIGLV